MREIQDKINKKTKSYKSKKRLTITIHVNWGIPKARKKTVPILRRRQRTPIWITGKPRYVLDHTNSNDSWDKLLNSLYATLICNAYISVSLFNQPLFLANTGITCTCTFTIIFFVNAQVHGPPHYIIIVILCRYFLKNVGFTVHFTRMHACATYSRPPPSLVPRPFFLQLYAGSKKGPGTHCMGDSAHAPQITQNLGKRTTNVKLQ